MSSGAWLSLYDRLWALFPPRSTETKRRPAPERKKELAVEIPLPAEEEEEKEDVSTFTPLEYVEEDDVGEEEEILTPEPQLSLYRIPLYILEKSLGDLSLLTKERHVLYWSDYKGNLHAHVVNGGQTTGNGGVSLRTQDGLTVQVRSPAAVTVVGKETKEEEPVFCVGVSLETGEPVTQHYPQFDFAPAHSGNRLSSLFRTLEQAADEKKRSLTFGAEMALRESYVRNNLYDAKSPFPCFFADALRKDLYARYPDQSPDNVNAWVLRLQSTVKTMQYDYIPKREDLSWRAKELLRFETEWQEVAPYKRVCKGIELALRSFELEEAPSRDVLEYLAYARSTGASVKQLTTLYNSWQEAKESGVPAERWIRQQRARGDKKKRDAFRQEANTLNRYARTVQVYIWLSGYRMKKARCAMTMLSKFIEHTEN